MDLTAQDKQVCFCFRAEETMNKIDTNRYSNGLIAILLTALLLCGAGMLCAKAAPAFASEDAVMEVYYDDTLLKGFTLSELEAIAAKEGSKSYTYTGFNTYPTGEAFEAIKGPTVSGVLDAALQSDGRQLSEISEEQTIVVRGTDSVKEEFLKGTLLNEDRYCFPNFMKEKGREGKAALQESMAGAEKVPALIGLTENGRLFFGQTAPNEQNKAAFIYHLFRSTKSGSCGRITIHSPQAGGPEALSPIKTAETGEDGIDFDRSVNKSHMQGGTRYWIYYTTDGSEPDTGSEMYNYNNNAFGQTGERFNRPKAGQTLKVRVIGYDRPASAVTTFRFPGKAAFKSLTAKKKTVTVKWKKAANADGYQIWRAEKKSGRQGEFKLVKTVKKGAAGSWKNTGLKKGKTFCYKIRAVRTTDGNKGYGSFSAVRNIKVK